MTGVQTCDRKSTRLNSSHTIISYAVFCLKKKKHRSALRPSSPCTPAPPPSPTITHPRRAPWALLMRHCVAQMNCIQPQVGVFFFNDTATTEIYTLSLHDALPICAMRWSMLRVRLLSMSAIWRRRNARSEEHTSELQSHDNLVCRLLLEKKKHRPTPHGQQRPTSALLSPPSRCTPRPSQRCRPRSLTVASGPGWRTVSFFFLKSRAPPELSPFPPRGSLPT